MTQQELDGLLKRFNGEPGVSGGLTHDETIIMFQALIDNRQIYNDPELCAWAEVYAEAGWVKGFNEAPVSEAEEKPPFFAQVVMGVVVISAALYFVALILALALG